MELKCDLFQLERKGCNAFNRTAYGIEIAEFFSGLCLNFIF